MEPKWDDTLTDRSEISAEEDIPTQMEQSWWIEERRFVSNVPIFGPVIAFIRTQWNQVAARWYVRALLEQQNQFNRLVLELSYQVSDMQTNLNRLIAQQADLVSDRGLSISTLSEGVSRLNARVGDLEERLKITLPEVTDDDAAPETAVIQENNTK